MTSDRWLRIENLYHAVLERSAEQRGLFLSEVCREDESLRQEVESLLAFHERATGFMESGPDEVAAQMLAEEPTFPPIGSHLGHYRILSLLGAGGMGEVYWAQDITLGREVAIKLLSSDF